MRRSPLKRRSSRKAVSDAALAEARRLVEWRACGYCELNTPACPPQPHRGTVAHHRLMRSQGGNVHDPELMAWGCDRGHRWVHDHPAASYEAGWLIRGVH